MIIGTDETRECNRLLKKAKKCAICGDAYLDFVKLQESGVISGSFLDSIKWSVVCLVCCSQSDCCYTPSSALKEWNKKNASQNS